MRQRLSTLDVLALYTIKTQRVENVVSKLLIGMGVRISGSLYTKRNKIPLAGTQASKQCRNSIRFEIRT